MGYELWVMSYEGEEVYGLFITHYSSLIYLITGTEDGVDGGIIAV
jgi:hypothetical protein